MKAPANYHIEEKSPKEWRLFDMSEGTPRLIQVYKTKADAQIARNGLIRDSIHKVERQQALL